MRDLAVLSALATASGWGRSCRSGRCPRHKVEHVIKNQDGKIGSENSYGNGPG